MTKIIFFQLAIVNCVINYFWNLIWNLRSPRKVDSRVISVGNIAVGGTGKTSLVEYIASELKEDRAKIAVVARGYKRPSSSSPVVCDSDSYDWKTCGDEAAALAKSLNGIKIYVNRSKTDGAIKASGDGNKVIIIDDGFQHRKLYRDLDIVCINGDNPFGNGMLLPSGILREPVRALKRADAFVIFSDEDCDISQIKLPEGKPVFCAKKIIAGIMASNNVSIDLKGRKVIGFCGLANPDSFHNTLKSAGANIMQFIKFKDHYIFNDNDIAKLRKAIENSDAEFGVTTLKDYVKLERIWPDDGKLCYIKIKLAIENDAEFIRLLKDE